MKKLCIALALAVSSTFVLAACKKDKQSEEPSENAAYKTVAFEETEALCADNEGQGWVILEEPLEGGLPSLGYKGTFPEVKTISLSTGWSCFEKTPDHFDWTVMDETIAYWAEKGKTINMRLCTDGLVLNQGVVNGCPSWLFEAPYNVASEYNGEGTDKSIYADLSNVKYQERLRIFLEEFAGHYGAADYPYRDAIEVVELRGYGMVGEWHSGYNQYPSVEARTQALRDTIKAWRDAWGDTLLVLSCTYEFLPSMGGITSAANYDEFMHWMGYDYALTLDNITFRRDGIAFALREWDSRMARDYFDLNTGLPLLGEIGDGYAKHAEDSAYPLFEAMNEALHKWRVNYQTVIGWVAQDFDIVIREQPALVEYFNRYMGYRLVPDTVQYSHQVKAGDKLYLNSLWTNKAMGRCWTDHDLSVYLLDGEGNVVYTGTDARFNPVSINGGEPHFFNLSYQLPDNLPKGEYTLKFAVTDSQGVPQIELPIANGDDQNRYELGKVTVGDTAAPDLSKADKIDESDAYKAIGEGSISSRGVTVDGTKALIGKGSGVFAQGEKLENGKTYYVSFDYKTDKEKSTITIDDPSHYQVGAFCAAESSWGDSYLWRDVSNELSHRSVTITVPDDGKEYRLAFGGVQDVAKVAIDNVSVEEAEQVKATFLRNPEYAEEEDGVYTLECTSSKTWANALRLRERLEPHQTYMITFDANVLSGRTGRDAFYYVTLLDPNYADENSNILSDRGFIPSYTETRIGSFWTPKDYGYVKYSYVFNTENYGDGWQLVFGVREAGRVAIRNITLTKLYSDSYAHRDPLPIAHNVVPDKHIDVDAEGGVYENFETGVFNGGCMFPGVRTTGIIRRDTHNISGHYSCFVYNENQDKDYYEFHVYCKTNSADFNFSANTTYRLKFNFMILEDVGWQTFRGSTEKLHGHFGIYARRDSSGSNDVGAVRWNEDGENRNNGGRFEVNKVYTFEYTFTTGPYDDYHFEWYINLTGGIAIDDVWFEKTDTSMSEPKITEGRYEHPKATERLYEN